MADSFPRVRYNEEVPLNSGTFAPVTGTITLSAVTVTLRDNLGVVVSACNGVPATSFTSGASAAPSAQFIFSASELSLPVPTTQDVYTLEFDATDTAENTYASVLCIVIVPPGR